MIEVVIFEDNKHLRNTFELLLQQTNDMHVAGSWGDCSNLVEKLSSIPCDVVLMDIEMPGMDGIAATKIIKENYPHINILIQTVFNEDDYIFKAICNGASGYLLKDTSPDQYIDAIRDVQRGGSPMTPGIARRVLELFKDGFNAKASPDKYGLTDKEKQVLSLLVAGKSYKMIANSLAISTETVKSHMRNIYAKLHVHSGTEAVALALKDRIV